MSFAGTAARGSAIPTPVTGMTTYLEDTKDLQVYDGSAYSSPFGMTLVKSQTVGSGVSSVVVSDVFSANYDAYKVIWSGGVGSTNSFMTFRFGTANTEYYQVRIGYLFAGSPDVGTDNNTAQFTVMARYSTSHLSCEFDVINPFLARHTLVHSGNAVGNVTAEYISGVQKSNTSFTAFTLTCQSGNVTGGTLNVYGYRKN
jgi:hypothetical protein